MDFYVFFTVYTKTSKKIHVDNVENPGKLFMAHNPYWWIIATPHPQSENLILIKIQIPHAMDKGIVI